MCKEYEYSYHNIADDAEYISDEPNEYDYVEDNTNDAEVYFQWNQILDTQPLLSSTNATWWDKLYYMIIF